MSAPVLWLPFVGLGPEMLPPVSVHAVALVDCQFRVVEPPFCSDADSAVNDTVGAGTTVTVCDAVGLVPPEPVQRMA